MRKKSKLEFVANDVELVEKNARHVLEIISSGVNYKNNPLGPLNIIAVIGQGELSGRRFEKAVLCEIGLGGKVPYKRLFLSGGKSVSLRIKKFSLTAAQYQEVAASIFGLLQELVDKRTKNLNHLSRYILSPRHWLSRGKKDPRVTETAVTACKGIKFVVDCRDNLLLADLYWAVFRKYARQVQWTAKAVHYTACNFRWNLNRDFRASVEFSWIQHFLEMKLNARFLRIEVIDNLPGGRASPCFPYLAEALNWDGFQTKEKELCVSALSGPLSRVGQKEIFVSAGLEKQRQYAIFRIFPSKEAIRERDASLLAERYGAYQGDEDELPF